MVKIKPDEISSIIAQQLERYDQEVKYSNVGVVMSVKDRIARVYGLEQVITGELLEFADNTIGLALNWESNNVEVVLMGDGGNIQEGTLARATGNVAQIPMEYVYLDQDFFENLFYNFWILHGLSNILEWQKMQTNWKTHPDQLCKSSFPEEIEDRKKNTAMLLGVIGSGIRKNSATLQSKEFLKGWTQTSNQMFVSYLQKKPPTINFKSYDDWVQQIKELLWDHPDLDIAGRFDVRLFYTELKNDLHILGVQMQDTVNYYQDFYNDFKLLFQTQFDPQIQVEIEAVAISKADIKKLSESMDRIRFLNDNLQDLIEKFNQSEHKYLNYKSTEIISELSQLSECFQGIKILLYDKLNASREIYYNYCGLIRNIAKKNLVSDSEIGTVLKIVPPFKNYGGNLNSSLARAIKKNIPGYVAKIDKFYKEKTNLPIDFATQTQSNNSPPRNTIRIGSSMHDQNPNHLWNLVGKHKRTPSPTESLQNAIQTIISESSGTRIQSFIEQREMVNTPRSYSISVLPPWASISSEITGKNISVNVFLLSFLGMALIYIARNKFTSLKSYFTNFFKKNSPIDY